jgi:hypothetical protein
MLGYGYVKLFLVSSGWENLVEVRTGYSRLV